MSIFIKRLVHSFHIRNFCKVLYRRPSSLKLSFLQNGNESLFECALFSVCLRSQLVPILEKFSFYDLHKKFGLMQIKCLKFQQLVIKSMFIPLLWCQPHTYNKCYDSKRKRYGCTLQLCDIKPF